MAAAATASAAEPTTTFSATETIPVPPASNYAGSGGGDGWAVALSSTSVYNVFHHSDALTVACHNQSDASACYSPETITDETGNNFATSGHPGMYLDQKTGKLYVYATRTLDGTAGVVCFDTTVASTNPNPFCGFTALTPVGQGPLDASGISGLSVPMLIGTHWYTFNFVNGASVSGAENELLCFDVSTDAACKGQPFAVPIGAGAVEDNGFPSPATAAIGNQVIVPINIGGTDELACFDDSTQSSCTGSWPVMLVFGYAGVDGSPFPLLDSTGKLTGICIPTGADQCFTRAGASTPTPAGMTAVIGASTPWNGTAFVLGPRIYVPNGNSDTVQCFDYSTDASCVAFPKSFTGLGYLYTVNPDPQRPTCIWANADNGSAQIQNFDAYTGGACGEGSIRVLASRLVVPQEKCTPASYVSLQVLSPAPSTYTSGSVTFDDGDGNPLPGVSDRALDATGTVDLTGLSLNTATGLPQFLITLNGATGAVGAVEVKLTWTATYDPTCIGPNTKVAAQPTEPPPPTPTAPGTTAPPPTPPASCHKQYRVVFYGTDKYGREDLINHHALPDLACVEYIFTDPGGGLQEDAKAGHYVHAHFSAAAVFDLTKRSRDLNDDGSDSECLPKPPPAKCARAWLRWDSGRIAKEVERLRDKANKQGARYWAFNEMPSWTPSDSVAQEQLAELFRRFHDGLGEDGVVFATQGKGLFKASRWTKTWNSTATRGLWAAVAATTSLFVMEQYYSYGEMRTDADAEQHAKAGTELARLLAGGTRDEQRVGNELYTELISSAYAPPNSVVRRHHRPGQRAEWKCLHSYAGADPGKDPIGCSPEFYLPLGPLHHRYRAYQSHLRRQVDAYLKYTAGGDRLGFAVVRLGEQTTAERVDCNKKVLAPTRMPCLSILSGAAGAIGRVMAGTLPS